jgi:hypothetical protein
MNEAEWFSQTAATLWVSFMAFVGIMARHAHSGAVQGKINWRAFAIDGMTAPALGVITFGIGKWFGVPDFAQAAMVAFIGFLGPAFLRTIGEMARDKWLAKPTGYEQPSNPYNNPEL